MNSDMFRTLFGCEPEKIQKNVILTPFIPLKKFTASGSIQGSFRGRFYHGINVSDLKGSYSVINCGIGSQVAGDCAVLLGTTPARNILFAGSCAGLGDLELGDIILCEEASDGTGYSLYAGEKTDMHDVVKKGISFRACRKILRYFSNKPGICKGKVFTIGSLLAETSENIEIINSNGFTAIDMEVAAVYNGAGISGIETAGLLFVSDVPYCKPFWRKLDREDISKYKKGMETMTQDAVEYMLCR